MQEKFLLTSRSFWPLFWTQFLGALNDNTFKTVLVILVTYKNISIMNLDTASLVAISTGIFILPYFIFSATTSQICETYQKATIIRTAKILEVAIMGMATLGLYLDNWVLLFICLFLMGSQSSFFGPVKLGILPDIVPRARLVTANAFINGATFFCILSGTILGGILGGLEDYILPCALALLGFASAGLITSFFQQDVKVHSKEKVNWNLVTATVKVLWKSQQDQKIFQGILGYSWLWFMGASLISIIPVASKTIFHGTESVATLFLATLAVGMAMGSALANLFAQGRAEMGFPPFAAGIMSGMMLLMAYACHNFNTSELAITIQSGPLQTPLEFIQNPNGVIALLSVLGTAIAAGTYAVCFITYLQENSPLGTVAKTIASANIWNALSMVLSSVMIVVLKVNGFSLTSILVIVAALNGLVLLLLIKTYLTHTLRFLLKIYCHLLYKVEIKGQENIPHDQSHILCSNHVTLIDWIFVASISPKPPCFVIGSAYYFHPKYFKFLKFVRAIPIASKKSDKKLYDKAFKIIQYAIDNGETLAIFPEGKITLDGKVAPFKRGLEKIINDAPIPVIPVSISGLWPSWFSKNFRGTFRGFPFRIKVSIFIGKPISPQNLTSEDVMKEVQKML